MAIKFSVAGLAGLPENLVSISGGWSSAPESGGIITLAGNATFVDKDGGTTSYVAGDSAVLGDIGTVYITSSSTDKYLGYSKTSISFTDELGNILKNKSFSRRSRPLIACTRGGATASEVITQIGSIIGVPLSLPRTGSAPIFEPIWAKDGQSIISLLNEILTTSGCILYCKDGAIKAETISEFFGKLSGTSNNNTISSTFSVDGGISTKIDGISLSGTYQKIEKGPYVSRNIVDIQDIGDTKTVTTENYEPVVSLKPSIVASINDCYPVDNGRILSRITETYHNGPKFKKEVYDPGETEFYNSCNTSYRPVFGASFGGSVLVEKVIETWVYNTISPTVETSSDSSPVLFPEKITYTRTVERIIAMDNSTECSPTLGIDFSEYLQDDDGTGQAFALQKNGVFQASFNRIPMEEEIIEWNKPPGSYKWNGKKTKKISAYMADFNMRRGKIEEYKKKLDSGKLSSTPALFRINFPDLSQNYNLRTVGSEFKEDWKPEFGVFPASEKVINIPWSKEIPGGGGGGETLTLNGGRFALTSELTIVGNEIKDARAKRAETLAVTNINEIFKVGEIDAPSFSADVNGIRTSGVYLNG